MSEDGESSAESIRHDFMRSTMLDFQGAKPSSDMDFMLMRKLDHVRLVLAAMVSKVQDHRLEHHAKL